MAHKKQTKKTTKRTLRVTTANANRRLQRPAMTPSLNFGGPVFLLEDRRQFHPDGPFNSARGFTTTASTPTLREPYSVGGNTFRPYNSQTKATIAYKAPSDVAVCIRRKRRKEIMHAIGAAGGKVRKPRRNYLSDQRC